MISMAINGVFTASLSGLSGLAANLGKYCCLDPSLIFSNKIKIVFYRGRSQSVFSVGYKKFVTVLFWLIMEGWRKLIQTAGKSKPSSKTDGRENYAYWCTKRTVSQ
jgi:hypothetical protein